MSDYVQSLYDLVTESAMLDFREKDQPTMAEMIESHADTVKEFCSLYQTGLVQIDFTCENDRWEPFYVFDDGLEGYTIDGLQRSIQEAGDD